MKEILPMEDSIAVWEGEGGSLCLSWFCLSDQAAPAPCLRAAGSAPAGGLTGTVNQIEWAARIKERVNAEFDRVANALRSVAVQQADQDRVDTHAIIGILEEKRAQVMARTQAGYFIHDWQELSDQVRRMIVLDPRYLILKSSKAARGR